VVALAFKPSEVDITMSHFFQKRRSPQNATLFCLSGDQSLGPWRKTRQKITALFACDLSTHVDDRTNEERTHHGS